MAGSGDGDEAGEESEGRGVEKSGAEVELGAELENISWVEEAADELLGGAVDVAAGADVVAGAAEVASVKMSTALECVSAQGMNETCTRNQQTNLRPLNHPIPLRA